MLASFSVSPLLRGYLDPDALDRVYSRSYFFLTPAEWQHPPIESESESTLDSSRHAVATTFAMSGLMFFLT